MRIFRKLAVFLAVVAFFSTHAALADQHLGGPAPTVTDLTGHWDSVEINRAVYTGENWGTTPPEATQTIEIHQQDGFAFWGQISWSYPSAGDTPANHDGIQLTNSAVEDFVGVFSGDGSEFVIAEHPDTGLMLGRVLDADRLEILYAESGDHALAMRTIFERRQ